MKFSPYFLYFSSDFGKKLVRYSGSVFAEGYKLIFSPYLYIFRPVLERNGHSRCPEVATLLIC